MLPFKFSVTELENMITRANTDYMLGERMFSKTKLKYGVYDNLYIIEQNKEKTSIYAKLKQAGFDVRQIMYKQDESLRGVYIGVIINNDIFIYESALEHIDGIDRDILWMHLLVEKPKNVVKRIEDIEVSVLRNAENKKIAFSVYDGVKRSYMFNLDYLKTFVLKDSSTACETA
uniref:Uncharacterized protein n=1 Tax=Fervidobacterium pennivorans TaxID=93466 RepID=A0A7V4FGM2_FERPE